MKKPRMYGINFLLIKKKRIIDLKGKKVRSREGGRAALVVIVVIIIIILLIFILHGFVFVINDFVNILNLYLININRLQLWF